MRWIERTWVAGTLGTAVLLFAATALAQEAADQPAPQEQPQDQKAADAQARLHFQSGASHYEAGEYALALEEFKSAYQISKRPELFYNISLAYQQMDDYENAVLYLKRYLEEVPNIPNRTNLERRLQNFQERLEAQKQREQEEQQQQRQQQQEQQQQQGQGGTFEGDTVTRPVTQPEEKAGVPVGAWIGWGVGAVGLITFAGAGVAALKSRSDADNLGCGDLVDCPDLADEMDRRALIADVGLAVGIVGAAVGTVLFFVGRKSGTEEPAPTARLQLSPWVAKTGGGAVLGGSF